MIHFQIEIRLVFVPHNVNGDSSVVEGMPSLSPGLSFLLALVNLLPMYVEPLAILGIRAKAQEIVVRIPSRNPRGILFPCPSPVRFILPGPYVSNKYLMISSLSNISLFLFGSIMYGTCTLPARSCSSCLESKYMGT